MKTAVAGTVRAPQEGLSPSHGHAAPPACKPSRLIPRPNETETCFGRERGCHLTAADWSPFADGSFRVAVREDETGSNAKHASQRRSYHKRDAPVVELLEVALEAALPPTSHASSLRS